MAEVDKLPIDVDDVATYASFRKRWAIELAATIPNVGDVVSEAERICRYIWPHQFKDGEGQETTCLSLARDGEEQRPELYAYLRRVLSKTLTEELAKWKNAG